MFCSNCGKEIDNNAIKCPYCGLRIKENFILNTIFWIFSSLMYVITALALWYEFPAMFIILGIVFTLIFCPKCGIMLIEKYNKKPSEVKFGFLFVGIYILVWSILLFIDFKNETKQDIKDKSYIEQTDNNSSKMVDSTENTMNEYYENKINKGIQKFNMAKQQNDSVNACISARFVAQYYYDLIDEQNYNKWKNIEKQSCSWMNY